MMGLPSRRMDSWERNGGNSGKVWRRHTYSYSEKGCRKNVHATIPKGNMGYDQYTVPDDCSCRTYFCCFPLALATTFPWPFVPILSNFFEKKRTQKRSQCLSGLSRALFPTTFLQIAVLLTFIAFIETICSKIWTKEPHKNA